MIILGRFDEFGKEFGFPGIWESVSDEPFEHKDLILDYMKSKHVCMAAPGFIQNVITGETVYRQRNTMNDGVYI